MAEKLLLQMKNITKEFPGVRALDGVTLNVKAGSVHALMGENGAGKSTLMKCLFGIYEKDGGEIILDGETVNFKSPRDALQSGVAMVHQELSQAMKVSVADNIFLGRHHTHLGFITDDRKNQDEALKIFNALGIKIDPRVVIGRLSVAERQMVEIAKAVSYNSKVIVLDEPTSSLSDHEVERLFKIIENLKSRGCGIIYISHKMEEILRISDTVSIMRDGRLIDTLDAAELTVERIINLMVGRELGERFPEKTNKPQGIALEVKNLSSKYKNVRDVSFYLRRGEVVGFAGLAGAGRSELFENIFGLSAREGGEIYFDGKRIYNRTPTEAVKNKFAFLTEERRASGIFSILDICENSTLGGLSRYSRAGFISDKRRLRDTEWVIRSMRVKTPNHKTKISTLSGGNQQKVILGRWILTEPEILILDEPTRGIDVGAKFEIYQEINRLAAAGKGVAVISSELPELLGVCDRIYVMSGGRIAGEVDAASATQEEIMTLATKYV